MRQTNKFTTWNSKRVPTSRQKNAGQLPHQYENLYVVVDNGHEIDPVEDAGYSCWDVVYDHVGTKKDEYNEKISSFTNTAWDTHEKVGCAIVKCPKDKKTHVVCHYGPERTGLQIHEASNAAAVLITVMKDSAREFLVPSQYT
ncbi:hypothetical protein ANCDUO_05019 [Ancylostoma duodenale]|uniref:SCP domain-containing protein n=1 Tax=Ancylostoma duodenale TaxID=51022 RepID=A0A0C2GZM0_9BILA|nr:hypothetical protein ANCDUO_05019 [Ancylostoma duodenale]